MDSMRGCMDWKRVNFDWNHARSFLVTADEGSLSAAARALGMTQPTLGRQVAALEDELGVVLFERVGRGLELTDAGHSLLDHVRAMADAAGNLSLSATGRSQSVGGTIRITASEIYAAYLLPPLLEMLRKQAPELTIEVVASNDIRDLQRREADIALRNTRPSEEALIAKRVVDDEAYLFATEAMVEKLGDLSTPAAMRKADFIGLPNNGVLIEGLQAMGLKVGPENFRIHPDNHLVHWEMARQGLGVGVVPVWLGDSAQGMARVDCGIDPIPYPVWLVAHREVQTSRKVRLVYDLLAQEIPRMLRV
ncbi:DNA-binding transcriptional LysR family regulator [Donghicola tyrosinivorans]|uniref:DNA-binding transcriptional LysR family regulator n=2 Tax=Donghicola tyrosinivorans TaxID=1652492 RepID=A0A2T0WZJ9_9RHOB|nr:DNA-binding transcriptional LysR family regulator [Donghicola tyrosinivorans]